MPQKRDYQLLIPQSNYPPAIVADLELCIVAAGHQKLPKSCSDYDAIKYRDTLTLIPIMPLNFTNMITSPLEPRYAT